MQINGSSYLSPIDLKHFAADYYGVAPDRIRAKLNFNTEFEGTGKHSLRFYCNFGFFVLDQFFSCCLSFRGNNIMPFQLDKYKQEPQFTIWNSGGFFSDKFSSRGGSATALYYEFTVI